MRILYLSENYTGRPTFKIVVNSGEVPISAILTTKDKEIISDHDYPDGPEPEPEPVPDPKPEPNPKPEPERNIEGCKFGLGKPAVIGISLVCVIVVLILVTLGAIWVIRKSILFRDTSITNNSELKRIFGNL